jgi:hypothetical protein
MAAMDRGLRWYQFGVGSLLLLTTCTAVLCSIGVHIHWTISVLLGFVVLIGGVTGRIVARTQAGFLQGAILAILAFVILSIDGFVMLIPFMPWFQDPTASLWYFVPASWLAGLIGGTLGGRTVRPRFRGGRRILPQEDDRGSAE